VGAERTYTFACTHVRTHPCMHTHIHPCVQPHSHIRTHTHTHTHTCVHGNRGAHERRREERWRSNEVKAHHRAALRRNEPSQPQPTTANHSRPSVRSTSTRATTRTRARARARGALSTYHGERFYTCCTVLSLGVEEVDPAKPVQRGAPKKKSLQRETGKKNARPLSELLLVYSLLACPVKTRSIMCFSKLPIRNLDCFLSNGLPFLAVCSRPFTIPTPASTRPHPHHELSSS
jgi:hypothetical protein